ncbi:MAG: hypothetical protein Q7U59_12220 [Lutibacter sp.]|nr:hypothetical protein [Lutibacter sp.]
MKYIIPFLLIILLTGFSCNKNKDTQEVTEISDSLKLYENHIENKIGETLIPEAKAEMDNWKEYQLVDELLLKYYSISTLEALSNADELSRLVKMMKDSIKIEKLKQPNIIARINVLENETLRLADMATIPSITKDEVKAEVGYIVAIYSALNAKINTIYKSESIQNMLEVDTEVPIDLQQTTTPPPYLYRERTKLIKNPN